MKQFPVLRQGLQVAEGGLQERSSKASQVLGPGQTWKAQPRKVPTFRLFPNHRSSPFSGQIILEGSDHHRHTVLLAIPPLALAALASLRRAAREVAATVKFCFDKQVSGGRELARLDSNVLALKVNRLAAHGLDKWKGVMQGRKHHICQTQVALSATGSGLPHRWPCQPWGSELCRLARDPQSLGLTTQRNVF